MTTEPTVLPEKHLVETYLHKYVLKFYNLNILKAKKNRKECHVELKYKKSSLL